MVTVMTKKLTTRHVITVMAHEMLPKATVITNELPDMITVMANEMQPQVIDVQ